MTIFNINKNNSLEALQQFVEQNLSKKLSYMPESFNAQQQQALELFKQRLFLEKIIDEAISFNKNLYFRNKNKNLHLATTAEDLIDVFKLRSDVYTSINYQNEFPDFIGGLNFDIYDSNSAIFLCKKEKIITGTVRLIFDSHNKLPTEDKLSFDEIRMNYNVISEISRLVVKKEANELSMEFKYLFGAVYTFFMENNLDIILTSIIKKHYKLYSKFGGTKIINDMDRYGNLEHSVMTLTWDPSQASPFFKKAFLD